MAKQFFSILLITLMLLAGTVMFASPAFAVPCYDAGTGRYIGEFDTCPDGTTGNWSANTGNTGGGGAITTFEGLLTRLVAIMNTVVPFLVSLAVFVIIYGVFKYVSHAADEEKRTEARLFIVWGVIGVFFMLSIWGLVNILVNTLPLRRTPVPVDSIFPSAGN